MIETALHIVANLSIVVAIPADTCVIAGVSGLQYAHAALTIGLLLAKHADRRLPVENVFQETEVEQVNEYFRRETKKHFPERLSSGLSP